MSAKHTPGPWMVGAHGPNGCYTVGTEKGLMTAMVAHSVNHPEQADQAIGDARLISAAPDLLEALQAVMEFSEGYGGMYDWQDEARAAIAKATGRHERR